MLWWQNMEKSSRTELEASSLVAGFHNTNRCCVGPWGEKLSTLLSSFEPCQLQYQPALQGRHAHSYHNSMTVTRLTNPFLIRGEAYATGGDSRLKL